MGHSGLGDQPKWDDWGGGQLVSMELPGKRILRDGRTLQERGLKDTKHLCVHLCLGDQLLIQEGREMLPIPFDLLLFLSMAPLLLPKPRVRNSGPAFLSPTPFLGSCYICCL